MTVYTFSDARQKLASLLDQARSKGEVLIRRKDGSMFVVKPFLESGSPLDVDGVDIGISREEIVDVLREVRER